MLIIGGALIATMSAPMACADSRSDDGGYTSISNIDNHNTYNYQGVGTITLDNILGTGTPSSLLSPVSSLVSRLTS